MTKLIHPKTGTVREIDDTNQLKLRLLKRAGFILFDKYRAPKPPIIVPEKTTADVVADHALEVDEKEEVKTAEVAIHVSPAARKLIEENDLDPALIEGPGKDGSIVKPDVRAYLAGIVVEEVDELGDIEEKEETE